MTHSKEDHKTEGQTQIKRELSDDMARERAARGDEFAWPEGLRRNPKAPGLCDPGRRFMNQDLDAIAGLIGTMMKDSNNAFSTAIHLEVSVHEDGKQADIRVLRQTSEWCVPYTFPASMLGDYLRAFWEETGRLDDGGLIPMRIVCYQNGRFWEEPRYSTQR